jgi:hypothetical protein
MNPIFKSDTIKYYMLNNEPVLVHPSIKKYWGNASWHELTDEVIEKLEECTLAGYNKVP